MNGRIRHPQLACVVLLALATLCCKASFVPDTLTSTLDKVFVPFVVCLLQPRAVGIQGIVSENKRLSNNIINQINPISL